jgi:cysteine-rich repeat protein
VWSGKEQCDDGNMVGNDLCNPNCTKPKLVFITSGSWNGNLGGLAGGDGKCQTLANAAALGGTYKAWLSNNTQQPAVRFTKSTTGYAR